jgi:hypothetical protein
MTLVFRGKSKSNFRIPIHFPFNTSTVGTTKSIDTTVLSSLLLLVLVVIIQHMDGKMDLEVLN